jgi:hypothetical protein
MLPKRALNLNIGVAAFCRRDLQVLTTKSRRRRTLRHRTVFSQLGKLTEALHRVRKTAIINLRAGADNNSDRTFSQFSVSDSGRRERSLAGIRELPHNWKF